MVGGEDLRHGEADGGRDLFLGTAAEGREVKGGIIGTEKFQSFDAGIGEVDADPGGRAEEALEVAGDAIGEGLDERAVDGFAGG